MTQFVEAAITSVTTAAQAATGEGPFDVPVGTYLWVVFWCVFAGVASFVRKVREGHRPLILAELLGEIVVSVFVGMVTYWLGRGHDVPEFYLMAMVAVCGHMGSRALFLFERMFVARFVGRLSDERRRFDDVPGP